VGIGAHVLLGLPEQAASAAKALIFSAKTSLKQ
jgi:hypothetical protein